MSGGDQTPAAAALATFAGVPAPGEVLASKYEIDRVLGAGGMGVVVAARHLQLGQLVAIKFMRSEAAQDTNAVNRFLREARAAVALSSEHVTKILDVGTLDSGAPYMVMEYLPGADLGQILKKNGRLSVSDAVSTMLQACEALAEAHVLGIIHRDLKPSNLFVTKRMDGAALVKVLDFGISKTVQLNTVGSQENLTASGLVIGSPLYMSPEQLRSAKAVDARSDIWSLGVILYELLSGESPFAGETLGETLARIVAEPPAPLRQRRPEVPVGLAAVVMQCLERDVERRIQTVGRLALKLAPFTPREATLSLERIARVSAAGTIQVPTEQGVSGSRTLTASEFTPDGGVDPGQFPAETGPPWLRSTASGDFRPGFRRFALVGAAASVALLAAGAAIYVFGGRPRDPQTVTTPAAAPSAAISAWGMVLPASPAIVEPRLAARVETSDLGVDAGPAVPPSRPPGQTRAPRQPRAGAAAPPGSAPARDSAEENLLERRQ